MVTREGAQAATDAPPVVRRDARKRRPSGAPPPLPRKIGTTGKLWLVLAAVAAVGLILLPIVGQPAPAARFETSVLRQVARLRTGWLTNVMRGINTVGSKWGTTAVAWAVVVALIGFRRWRHLFTFLGSFAVLAVIGTTLVNNVARPRPYGVEIIGRWGGFSMPSPPVAVFSLILMAIVYGLVVQGRPRQWAKWAIGGVIVVFAFARLYLAVDHPSDIVYGVILGVAIPLIAFRWFTPNEAFPVSYRRAKKAHLDVTGERGVAIQRAIEQQLGLTILEVKPVGLAGSGGSTPLRLQVEGGSASYLFAKLYAKSHVTADRWYKLGRTILYGALEDEGPFHTVRRLVEYEDYALRVLRDAGIPTAAAYGIVEITPEREYMLITEFVEGGAEIGETDVVVDDRVIDEGLALIRKLWDAGLAHRDIKPANLLVRDSRVYLIDPFFVQVRPSPWRQAVDLANMMLVLAVRTDPDRVYEHALKFFTPDEIAEAFAATRGVASPTQLRTAMKQDGRDLLASFRALAPERRPIAIQRWNVRRVALTLAVLAASLFIVVQATHLLSPVQDLPIAKPPECGTSSTVILMAQAVPSASAVPCIDVLPAGWTFGQAVVHNGRGRFWLNSDQAGHRAVVVTLSHACDVTRARVVGRRPPDTTRFEEARSGSRLSLLRFDRFPGGCATYDIDFDAGAPPALLADVERALAYTARTRLVRHVARDSGLVFCGRDEACPG
jgi:membrane-associated phospholipid phosphatase/tRNA A-37 threonylcarbamoyl transferase component Bud32